MADLITHLSLGYLLGLPLKSARLRVLFYLGCILPDFCHRLAVIGFQSAFWYAEPAHSLLGSALICYLLAHGFQEGIRAAAFLWIWLGYLSHLAVDLLKDNLGSGTLILFFPSMRRYEWGLYGPEESVDWMLFWILAVLAVEWIRPTLFQRGRQETR